MKKLYPVVLLSFIFSLSSFAGTAGKIAIAAHRGFWKCEEAANSQNSLASLRLAQENSFWGSECDIHLTGDGQIIVNHDHTINGLVIADEPFDKLSANLLGNGETRPDFDSYLTQAEKYAGRTVLVVEFKKQPTPEKEDSLVNIAIEKLKAHNMYCPEKVMFISFSLHICQLVAKIAPEFTNQYLNGDIAPSELAKDGINGIDYKYKALFKHPEWVKEAHDLGMTVNSWTVDSDSDIDRIIALGVDCITTNHPLVVREKLGKRELKCGKKIQVRK